MKQLLSQLVLPVACIALTCQSTVAFSGAAVVCTRASRQNAFSALYSRARDQEELSTTTTTTTSASVNEYPAVSISRRLFSSSTIMAAISASIFAAEAIRPPWSVAAETTTTAAAAATAGTEAGIPVMKTPSGLKYLDLEPGTGSTPRYGQLLTISYQAYIKLPPSKDDPNPKPELFEMEPAYLLKHGNGRTIPGLDEGLHTMKVGGKRRILIPPKLGYIESGLGPIPAYPWDRQKLNRLLNKMIDLAGGTLVFEVQLLSCHDDEADQGYYEDDSLTPEEFELLRNNIQRKVRERMALPTEVESV